MAPAQRAFLDRVLRTGGRDPGPVALDVPEGAVPLLAVCRAHILGLDHGMEKNQRGVLKINAVIFQIAEPFVLIPLEVHGAWHTNVATHQLPSALHP